MVLAGPQSTVVQRAGYPVFKPWFPNRPRQKGVQLPFYSFIADGNIQLIRDGFVRPWRFYAAVTEARRMVENFGPDVLIGDFSLLTWVIGRRLGLPVVQIAQSISYPPASKIIWWEDPPRGIVPPDIRPVVNPVLSRWKLDAVRRIEDLLRGDLYVIPSIPELEPLPGSLEGTRYTGALITESSTPGDQSKSIRGLGKQPLVYVTLGGGASPVGNVEFYEMINEAFGGTAWRVIVSTGHKFDPSRLRSVPSNVAYRQWVDGPTIIRQSDVVVFHGGHSTMMETTYYGIPSVVLPFHSEQEGNGRRLQAQSAAVVLSPTNSKNAVHLVHTRWKYGEFITCVQPFTPPAPEVLRAAVSTVLEDYRYRESAMKLCDITRGYGGAPFVADLLTQIL